MTNTRDLKPASENPWYVLMTIAGEQTRDKIDPDLHARNRRYWNGWAVQALTDNEKNKLFNDRRIAKDDLKPPLTDNERAEIINSLMERCGATVIPEPDERVDLGDTEYSEGLACAGFVFSRYANFAGATFSGNADFKSAIFSENADFNGATFSGDADFRVAIFSGNADFSSATFSGNADFWGATFSGNAVFLGATFSGNADFKRATFSEKANFHVTTFSGDTDFRVAIFSGDTNFLDATFSGLAAFQGAIFSESAVFLGATFSGYARFQGVTFSGLAAFQGATFSGNADFQGASFSEEAGFRGAIFSENAVFRGATFSGFAAFEIATFSGDADFSDGTFKSKTDFSETKFLPPGASPPQFFNAVLHEDTSWTDVCWPDPPDTRLEAIKHRRAYERLKLVMDSQNKFHDEHMFLRMELRCREIEEPHSAATWASRLFRWTSDYGWSIRCPAAGLGATLGLGWALIFIAEWLERWFGGCEYLGLGQSFALSLSNVFGFLGFSRTFLSDEIKTLTAFSEVVSATQTIVGLILFFLLGLALRNRFRIK